MAVCSLTLLVGEQESCSELEAKSEAGTTGREGPRRLGGLGRCSGAGTSSREAIDTHCNASRACPCTASEWP